MALADKKKVQTRVNISGDAVVEIRKQVQILKDVKVKFETHNPNVTGTPLSGIVASLNGIISSLDAAASNPNWDTVINGKVLTHRNKALE